MFDILKEADIWKFLAGLGIFIYAMRLVEDALKSLSGRQFKLFLKKHTNNKLKAIFSGTLVTAVLQSSSVVSLMTLAFVGAGVLSMQNALAVVLGANLGTTVTGWLIATLGFKFEIESFAFPLIGIAAISLIFFKNDTRFLHLAKFILGAGFLFLGLSFMKESMETLVAAADVNYLKNTNKYILILAGLLFTAIIQSSSATMAITLSAIYSGAFGFAAGAAIIIGAETGTTLKILLGALDGIPDKKRVAFGNFIFNIVLLILAAIFLDRLIWIVNFLIGIKDPLIALVLFQSLINFLSILIFLPFLKIFSAWLNKRFTKSEKTAALFISKANQENNFYAVEVLKNEADHLLNRAINTNQQAFSIKAFPEGSIYANGNSYEKNYSLLKQLEGEMISFYVKLKLTNADENQSAMQIISAARSALHSAKEIKNIHHNLTELNQSAEETEHNFYLEIRNNAKTFYAGLTEVLKMENQDEIIEKLKQFLQWVENNYNLQLHNIFKMVSKNGITEEKLSTFMNINREIYSSGKAIVRAIKDLKLNRQNAEIINNLPAYHADVIR